MNKIINPFNNQSYSIYSNQGKQILKQYLKIYQNGMGPYVKLSKTMLENLKKPSKHNKDCVACSLFFLGLKGILIKEILNYINKYDEGLTSSSIKKYINRFENYIRKYHKPQIIKDNGLTTY